MLELISQYVVIFGVGVVFLIIGIILIFRNKNLNKIVRATVIDCVKAESIICGSKVECFEITFEVNTINGVVHSIIKRQEPFDVGASFDVKYYQKEDRIELVKEENYNLDKLPIVLLSIGFFIIIAVISVCSYKTDVENFVYSFGALIGMIFAICGFYLCVYKPGKLNNQMKDCVTLQGMAFAFIGFWLCVLRPSKLKRQMKDCEIVLGTGVDYLNVGRTRDTDGEGFKNNYFPI